MLLNKTLESKFAILTHKVETFMESHQQMGLRMEELEADTLIKEENQKPRGSNGKN